MIIYHSTTHNPYFNIAAEEYFLKNFTDDFFILYINEPSVIVGKHQNTLAEINVPYIFANKIKVVRRLSGGGTVFHDSGNLNYCFIRNGKAGHLVNFKKYAQPILDTLQKLNVNAALKGKSDLVIDNLKFSGNAEHVFKNRVLHHGTLLFNSNINRLNEAINTDWDHFNDKAVRSNRSVVTNISDHLKTPITIADFKQAIMRTVFEQNPKIKPYELSFDDKEKIEQLVCDKYNTWQWNFAYSPNYQFIKTTQTIWGHISVEINIEKGRIKTLIFNQAPSEINAITNQLLEMPHEYEVIHQILIKNQQVFIRTHASEILKILF